MFLPVEEFKEFLALLGSEEDKANVPVFVSKNQFTTKQGMQISEILIQYQYDTNMLAVFKTSEGIDPVMLPTQQFFTALEYYTDKETVEKAQKKTKAMLDKQQKALENEYNKAIKVLQDNGFENIVPYTWSQ